MASWECPSVEDLQNAAFSGLVDRLTALDLAVKDDDMMKLKEFISSSKIDPKPTNQAEYDELMAKTSAISKEEAQGLFAMLGFTASLEGWGASEAAAQSVFAGFSEKHEKKVSDEGSAFDGDANSDSDSDSDSNSDEDKNSPKIEKLGKEKCLEMLEEWFFAHLAARHPPIVLTEVQKGNFCKMAYLDEEADDAAFDMSMIDEDKFTVEKRDKILKKAQAGIVADMDFSQLIEMLTDPDAWEAKMNAEDAAAEAAAEEAGAGEAEEAPPIVAFSRKHGVNLRLFPFVCALK